MSSNFIEPLRRYGAAARVLLVLTVILGVIYPLAVTGVGQVLFKDQANGSLITTGGKTVGSSLIGQRFTDADGAALAEWFQPRPSAAGDGYDPTASSASNLGPNNVDLLALVAERRAGAAALDGVDAASVTPDALTASGSGLDPHISPTYAYAQVARVAKARMLKPGTVKALVADHVEGRIVGILGEPTVNVLELNLALQALDA